MGKLKGLVDEDTGQELDDANSLGGGLEWIAPGASDDLTPDALNPAPFRYIFIPWETINPYFFGVPPNPACYERTTETGMLFCGDGSTETEGWAWPPRNNSPGVSIRLPALFDVAVDVVSLASEFDGVTKVYYPYLGMFVHGSYKTNYCSSIIMLLAPTTHVTPKVQGVFAYVTENDPHHGLEFADLSSLLLDGLSLRMRCETLYDSYYKRFSRVWRIGYYNPSTETWVTLTALIEVPFVVPPTPSTDIVIQRNVEAYDLVSNVFWDNFTAVPNPQDVPHLWSNIQFGISGVPDGPPVNGAAYFKNFRWESSPWPYTIPDPA